MNIEMKRNGKEVVVEVEGRLDTTSAPVLDKMLNENVGEDNSLILDFKGLQYISSAGLRVLLIAQKKMQQSGAMKVKNVREEIMDVFEMTGFADILTIE
jgi:anti-sigma B factor antagonist